MNWKKILLITGILVLVSLVVFAFLADQNIAQIYGGNTEVVDAQQFQPIDQAVCIQHVNLLSEDGSTFIPNQFVYLEHGAITSIDSTYQASDKWLVIDGTGKYLIPGLIDSHVHLFQSANDLLLYVANGVTEIREMIGSPTILTWREEISSGRIGPEMYVASPRVGSFGNIEGWFMGWTQGYDNITNAQEAEKMVKQYAEAGYDAVKVYSQLNKESYEAINQLAAAEGLDVVGHIPWDLELTDILRGNQSEIAHLEELMNAMRREFGSFDTEEGARKFLTYVEKRSQELAGDLKTQDISVTTTLWLTQSFVRQKFALDTVLSEVALAYENPGISEWDKNIPQGLGWLPAVNRYKLAADLTEEELAWRKIFWHTYGEACKRILAHLTAGGVRVMAGTDANLPPTVPGFSLHDELIAMHQAGMSKVDVLQAATAIPAKWLGSETGIIAPGYQANLVLLDADPLVDIAHTKQIRTVFLNGKVYHRELLDQMLAAVKQANDQSRKRDISQFVTPR